MERSVQGLTAQSEDPLLEVAVVAAFPEPADTAPDPARIHDTSSPRDK